MRIALLEKRDQLLPWSVERARVFTNSDWQIYADQGIHRMLQLLSDLDISHVEMASYEIFAGYVPNEYGASFWLCHIDENDDPVYLGYRENLVQSSEGDSSAEILRGCTHSVVSVALDLTISRVTEQVQNLLDKLTEAHELSKRLQTVKRALKRDQPP